MFFCTQLLWWSLFATPSYSVLLSQVEQLYTDKFTGYNRKLMPVLDQSDTTIVSMHIQLISINSFDHVSGELDLTMLFAMTWIEERITWDPTAYGGQTSLLVDAADLWRPQIYILQSIGTIQNIGDISLKPRVYYNGTVVWNPGSVIKVGCTVDVTYFPFDTQTCSITFGAWSQLNSELELKSTIPYVDTGLFNLNSQWFLSDESYVLGIKSTSFPPTINMQLVLKRNPLFYVVYIVIPLGLLGMVNNLVFMLPDTSGERMSVAVTVFLSFIVYLQMINSNVPESSNPMAYIYYYVLFLLIHSSLSFFLCIMSLRIHGRCDTVPQKLQTIIRFLLCGCFHWKISPKHANRNSSNVIEAMEADNISFKTHEMVDKEIDQNLQNQHEVTWKTVGDWFDRFIGICLFLIFAIFTTVSIMRVYTNTGL